MPRIESCRPAHASRPSLEGTPTDRVLMPRPEEPTGQRDLDPSHLKAFRDHEAARLLLAALGRRRGPLD